MGAGLQTGSEDGVRLLGQEERPAVTIDNPRGASPFLLIADHAGNAIPEALGDLGLPPAERLRHIAWDIGTAALGAALSRRLDAVFVHQRYSRLVIDCNRDPAAEDAIPTISDGTVIAGNRDLPDRARAARVAAVHEPYQQAIADEIERRSETVLVSLHSFTPVMGGVARPWDIGILHDGHRAGFARALLARLRVWGDLTVGDNQPYRMDATDHTVPRHAFPAALRYVEIEIRQDLLAADPDRWATILATVLPEALAP